METDRLNKIERGYSKGPRSPEVKAKCSGRVTDQMSFVRDLCKTNKLLD